MGQGFHGEGTGAASSTGGQGGPARPAGDVDGGLWACFTMSFLQQQPVSDHDGGGGKLLRHLHL